MKTITVQYEVSGTHVETYELEEGQSVQDLIDELYDNFPSIESYYIEILEESED